MQRTTQENGAAELESAMEGLNISHEQVQESNRGSDQHHGSQAGPQPSAQAQTGGTPKSSSEQVWYLKSIEFTTPSGETRTYNVITQNYNGCVVHHLWLVVCMT